MCYVMRYICISCGLEVSMCIVSSKCVGMLYDPMCMYSVCSRYILHLMHYA